MDPVPEREYLSEGNHYLQDVIPHLDHIQTIGVDPTHWTICTRERKKGEHCGHLWNDTLKYCFQTPLWWQINFRSVLLTKVFRQTDQDWVDKLSEIKIGEVSDEILEFLGSLRRPLPQLDNGIKPTRLHTHRKTVDQVNIEEFKRLQSQKYQFDAIDVGKLQSEDYKTIRDFCKEEFEEHRKYS